MTDKKAVTSSQGPEIQSVVNLLTDILDEFRKQVQSKTPEPLEGKALEAVNLFREIGATLALLPTITLKAEPLAIENRGTVRLTWSSTDAQTISIEQKEKLGGTMTTFEVTPVAGGFIDIDVSQTTIFTATAKGLCGSATFPPVEITVIST